MEILNKQAFNHNIFWNIKFNEPFWHLDDYEKHINKYSTSLTASQNIPLILTVSLFDQIDSFFDTLCPDLKGLKFSHKIKRIKREKRMNGMNHMIQITFYLYSKIVNVRNAIVHNNIEIDDNGKQFTFNVMNMAKNKKIYSLKQICLCNDLIAFVLKRENRNFLYHEECFIYSALKEVFSIKISSVSRFFKYHNYIHEINLNNDQGLVFKDRRSEEVKPLLNEQIAKYCEFYTGIPTSDNLVCSGYLFNYLFKIDSQEIYVMASMLHKFPEITFKNIIENNPDWSVFQLR